MAKGNEPKICGREFDLYLAKRLDIDPNSFPDSGVWSGAGDTFGAIGLKLNKLSMSAIDTILETQKKENLRFGQLAVKLGILSREEADRILEIQRFHRSLETGERLVANGVLPLSQLLRVLADFMALKSGES